jgi:hypothetical protein
MPRSDGDKSTQARLIRGGLIATIICVIIIGFGLFQSADYERQANNKRAEYSEYTYEKVAQSCIRIVPIERLKCVNEAFEAKRNYEANQYDLEAQRKSALWAYIMGAAAVIGMALSAVGVWLVKTTFDETRKANEIAIDDGKSAQKHSETVINLQVKQLEHMADASYKTLRAYVVIDLMTADIDFKDGVLRGIGFGALISNVGQTPARIFDAFSDCWLVPKGSPLPEANLFPKDDVVLDVSLGNTKGSQNVAKVYYTRNELECLNAGTHALIIFTVIRYRDIYERVQEVIRASEVVLILSLNEIESAMSRKELSDFDAKPIGIFTIPNYGKST